MSLAELELDEAQNEKQLTGSIKELCSIKVYARNISIMMIVWSFGSFAFFMVPFYLKNIKANIFYLSLATEFAELLASVVCAFISRIMDLRNGIRYSCIAIACGSFLMIFIASEMADDTAELDKRSTILNSSLILLTNFGIVLAFDLAYLINPTLFPTILLATAYGFCNIFGRLITISSPIVANVTQPWPLVILVVFSILVAILSSFLVKIK